MMSECGWLPEPCAWNIHSRILYRKVQIGNASAMVGRHCIACVAEHPVPYTGKCRLGFSVPAICFSYGRKTVYSMCG